MLLEFRRLQQVYGWNSCFSDLLNMEFAHSEVSTKSLQNPQTMSWNDHCELFYFVHDVRIQRILSDFFEKTKEKPTFQPMTSDDMMLSEYIYMILKDVREAATSIRSKLYPEASVIIPTISILLNKFQKLDTSDLTGKRSLMTSQLVKTLENIWKSCQENTILKTATFLDPRIKDHFFCKSHKNYLLTTYQEFEKKNFELIWNGVKREEDSPTDSSTFDLFINSRGSETPAEAPVSNLEKEVAAYLQEGQDSHTNPIEFWIKNKVKFPILKTLATQFLAIPAAGTLNAKRVFEDGEKMFPEIHLHFIKENLGYCAASMDIETLVEQYKYVK